MIAFVSIMFYFVISWLFISFVLKSKMLKEVISTSIAEQTKKGFKVEDIVAAIAASFLIICTFFSAIYMIVVCLLIS